MSKQACNPNRAAQQATDDTETAIDRLIVAALHLNALKAAINGDEAERIEILQEIAAIVREHEKRTGSPSTLGLGIIGHA